MTFLRNFFLGGIPPRILLKQRSKHRQWTDCFHWRTFLRPFWGWLCVFAEITYPQSCGFYYIRKIMLQTWPAIPAAPSYGGVLRRWTWCRYVLYRCCCDREYPPALQCLFPYYKMSGQKASSNYEGTPCPELLLPAHIAASWPPKYCFCSSAFQFVCGR